MDKRGCFVDGLRADDFELLVGAGVVIYSLSTRPNFFGPGIDVSTNGYPDFSPRTASRGLAEDKMPQESLETLAEETGGHSYLNSSALDDELVEALSESSAYYLLAWRPDSETQRTGKSRIKVTVKDRPDLKVRMRRHFFDFAENSRAIARTDQPITAANAPEADLKAALGSLYPKRDLPASVSANFVTTADKGTILNVSMQIDGESLSFAEPDCFASKVGRQSGMRSVPPRSSGWVGDRHANSRGFRRRPIEPTRYRVVVLTSYHVDIEF